MTHTDTPLLAITVESVREMLAAHTTEHTQPYAVQFHPLDCESIKDELNDHGTDARQAVVGVINGCLVTAHRDVSRGSARVFTRRVASGLPPGWEEKAVQMLRSAQAANPFGQEFTINLQARWGTHPATITGDVLRETSDAELRIWLAGEAAREGVVQ